MNFLRNTGAVIGALVMGAIIIAVGLAFSVLSTVLAVLFIPAIIVIFCWFFIDEWFTAKKENKNRPR